MSEHVTISWGDVTLCMDNDLFRKGFYQGRKDFLEDAPQQLSATELLWYISVLDAKSGHYRFGEEAICYLEEYLGTLIGYLYTPLMGAGGEQATL
jgi:hypothetical protein